MLKSRKLILTACYLTRFQVDTKTKIEPNEFEVEAVFNCGFRAGNKAHTEERGMELTKAELTRLLTEAYDLGREHERKLAK